MTSSHINLVTYVIENTLSLIGNESECMLRDYSEHVVRKITYIKYSTGFK